jgi:pyridoxal phosphate enzyme (YggS family)
MAGIGERLAEIRDRIAAAAAASGRSPADVTLLAVSKGQPATAVAEAVAAGQRRFGENYAQDLVAKAGSAPGVEWHFLGPIQRNKINALAPLVALWHAVDRASVVTALARRAPGAPVLVEVNVGGEAAKHGCPPAETAALVALAREEGLDPRGLMTIPPAHADPRPHFAALRELAGHLGLPELSMGMSADFELAVAEGATIVRVGEAIFGSRTTAPRLQR